MVVLADVGPDDLRAQHGLVQAQLTVELLHGGGLGAQRDEPARAAYALKLADRPAYDAQMRATAARAKERDA